MISLISPMILLSSTLIWAEQRNLGRTEGRKKLESRNHHVLSEKAGI